jgi:hypothetical protein|tara:strand:- start:73 stop:234 length:162 start_codon:yes stop_codon:yes gene_type:complete
MNMSELQLVMLEKGITIEDMCEEFKIKRMDFLAYLHGDKDIPKELRVFLGTYE